MVHGARLEKVTDGLFEGEEAVLHVIERIVGPLGLRVDESSPWVDARLSDGSRVHTQFLRTPFRGSRIRLIRSIPDRAASGQRLP
jgi:pilus assembly protein CpaF